MDDGLLVGPLQRLQDAFSSLIEALQGIQLTVNLSKCALWGPGTNDITMFSEDSPLRKVPITAYQAGSGLKVLGIPIGRPGETSFQDALLTKKVSALEDACFQLCGVPDPQLQHCLLRQCLDAVKVQFLLRTTNTKSPYAMQALQKADDAIYSVVEEMAGGGLYDSARAQVALPFSEGGCGVRVPTHLKGPARMAGILDYSISARKGVGVPDLAGDEEPPDFGHTIEILQNTLGATCDPLPTWKTDWASVRVADPIYAKQSWWMDKCSAARKRSLISVLTGRDAARVASQGSGIGTSWMQVVPEDETTNKIKAEDYRLGLRWSLGMPLLSPDQDGATCPACGTKVDVFGDHLLCCRRNNFYGRHFAVQESFASMAQAGDQPFRREVTLSKANSLPDGAALRPADMLLRAWQGGKDTAIDFTISHSLQTSQKPWTAEKAKAFVTL